MEWGAGTSDTEGLQGQRALGRRTHETAFTARPKPVPVAAAERVPAHYRVRSDKIDTSGTLRHRHIGLGRRHAETRVLVLIADLDVRVLTEDGELLRALTSIRAATTSP